VVSGSIFFAARLKEAVMRTLLVGCALISGALVVLAQSPSVRVIAQEKSSVPPKATQAPSKTAPKPTSNVDPQKEARIRELMDVTGAKNLGQQLIEAGMEQFRSSVQDSQPNNPRAKQFVNAFVRRGQLGGFVQNHRTWSAIIVFSCGGCLAVSVF
jgi:hypothetical protein